jgi:hypothetical protein
MLRLDEHPTRDCDPGAAKFQQRDSAPLSVLSGDALDGRFRCWRGMSGLGYTFSVYDVASCPAYEHAVMMAVVVAPDGGRRIQSIGDTGCFPDLFLANAARSRARDSRTEFHIHLLARSRAERLAVIADLGHARAS